MSQSNYITVALFAVISLVFLVDYLKKRKENSLEKSVEKFVEKESITKERSGVVNWILKRKKNITFFVILVSTAKLFLNYFVYTIYLVFKDPYINTAFKSVDFLMGSTKEGIDKYKEKIESDYLESLEDYDIVIFKNKDDVFRGVYCKVDEFTFKAFPANFSVHLENIFSYDLFLFLPCSIFFLILVWIFNDKIKAQ